MRSPFCILSVLGDLLDDGEVRFIEAVQTLEIARQRIEALAELERASSSFTMRRQANGFPLLQMCVPNVWPHEPTRSVKHQSPDEEGRWSRGL